MGVGVVVSFLQEPISVAVPKKATVAINASFVFFILLLILIVNDYYL